MPHNLPEQRQKPAVSVPMQFLCREKHKLNHNITQLATYRKLFEIIKSEKTEVFVKVRILRSFRVDRWQVGLIYLLFKTAWFESCQLCNMII